MICIDSPLGNFSLSCFVRASERDSKVPCDGMSGMKTLCSISTSRSAVFFQATQDEFHPWTRTMFKHDDMKVIKIT